MTEVQRRPTAAWRRRQAWRWPALPGRPCWGPSSPPFSTSSHQPKMVRNLQCVWVCILELQQLVNIVLFQYPGEYVDDISLLLLLCWALRMVSLFFFNIYQATNRTAQKFLKFIVHKYFKENEAAKLVQCKLCETHLAFYTHFSSRVTVSLRRVQKYCPWFIFYMYFFKWQVSFF